MNKTIIGIQIGDRFDSVERVQNILTEFGCIIKTRLGLHQQAEYNEKCTEKGLIILELISEAGDRSNKLQKALEGIDHVKVRSMSF